MYVCTPQTDRIKLCHAISRPLTNRTHVRSIGLAHSDNRILVYSNHSWLGLVNTAAVMGYFPECFRWLDVTAAAVHPWLCSETGIDFRALPG